MDEATELVSLSLTLASSFSRAGRSEARLEWAGESRAGEDVETVALSCEEKGGNCTVFGEGWTVIQFCFVSFSGSQRAHLFAEGIDLMERKS